MKSLWLFLGCFLVSHASVAEDMYFGVDAGYVLASVNGENFDPIMLGGKVGTYVEPQVGIELYAMTNVASDESLDIETELTYSTGLAMRFETPEEQGGRFYFLFGYHLSELDMNRSGTGQPGSERLDGVTYGGGLEFRLGKNSDYFLTIQGQRIYDDNDLQLDLVNLGVTFRF